MSTQYTLGNQNFTSMECGECGIRFHVPTTFYNEQRHLGAKGGWHCPNGHLRVFRESDADALRRERDRLAQRIAEKDDDIRHQRERAEAAERRVSAARGQITKLKNRAAAGICPCCNRHFTNLERHMAGKHPGYVKEPTADEQVSVN